MKEVVIYSVKEMLYDEVMDFVRKHAPNRYQYSNKFYKKRDRYNSAVAYLLLCIAYGQIIEECEIGKFGKPYFIFPEQFLSISHTLDIVCVAVSDVEIAIDCESNQSIDENIIDMTFTKKEKKQVENGILKKSNIWTAKEAISKFYNEDWYSHPRTEITFENEVVYDENNRDLILEFTDWEDISVCLASKSKQKTLISKISEDIILKLVK